jgi:hypothetical protein
MFGRLLDCRHAHADKYGVLTWSGGAESKIKDKPKTASSRAI